MTFYAGLISGIAFTTIFFMALISFAVIGLGLFLGWKREEWFLKTMNHFGAYHADYTSKDEDSGSAS